ncbi:class I SAM-dependent methyltransferase [Micrococcoides hystricis]|uniref:SAM-dependent methyltransferase n=1 Tax=Micrococcoides hystricis TaxID=1572761 RepID=A0ABV6PBF0_9MICC
MSAPSQAQRSLTPLLTPEGWELVNSLPAYDSADSDRLNRQLRAAGHSPELVAAALTQQQLRAQAHSKFGEFAQRMLLTRHGLEQATRLPVAAHHAQRFVHVGVQRVIDVGCGIGADTMANAALGTETVGVEIDEAVAAAATVNLMPFPNATVVHASAEDYLASADLASAGLWFDPARRQVHAAGGAAKVFDPAEYTPSLDLIGSLVDAGHPVGVKLAPAMPHDALPRSVHERGEIQYVSHNGDLVEVVLWFNELARPGIRRSALVLQDDAAPTEFTSSVPLPQAGVPAVRGRAGLDSLLAGGYVYEPDPALIRARLLDVAVEQVDGFLFDEHIAYFGAPNLHAGPGFTAYRLEEIRPYNVKKLRAWVKESGIGSLTIKKRGMDVTPEELRNLLLGKLSKAEKEAGRHQHLILTRVGQERLALVVSPATTDSAAS